MRLHDEIRGTKDAWPHLTFYEKFEQIVVLVLTVLIVVVVASATWHLAINIFLLFAPTSSIRQTTRFSNPSSA